MKLLERIKKIFERKELFVTVQFPLHVSSSQNQSQIKFLDERVPLDIKCKGMIRVEH